jgi:hypothetical protein
MIAQSGTTGGTPKVPDRIMDWSLVTQQAPRERQVDKLFMHVLSPKRAQVVKDMPETPARDT